MKKFSLLVVFVIVCSMVLGTNTQKASSDTDCDWPMFGRTPEGNRVVPDGCGPASDKLELKWKWEPYLPEISTNIVVNGGRIYYGTEKGVVVCVNESDLVKVWAYDTNDVMLNLQVIKDTIIVTNKSSINCFSKEKGEIKFSINNCIGIGFSYKPLIYKNSIIFSGCENDLYCYDLSNGKEKWRTYYDDPVIDKAITCANGFLFYGTKSYILNCRNANSGELIWSTPINNILNNIHYYNNKIYFIIGNGLMLCVNALTGKVESQYSTKIDSDNAIFIDKFLFGSFSNKTVFCIDLLSNNIKWQKTFDSKVYIGGQQKDIVIIFKMSDNSNDIIAIDKIHGQTHWEYNTNKTFIFNLQESTSVDKKDMIYFFGLNIFTLSIKTGKLIKVYDLFVIHNINKKPIIVTTDIIISSNNNLWKCIDSKTRNVLWEKTTNKVITNPLISSGKVILASNNLNCFDSRTGKLIWQNNENEYFTHIVLSDQYILARGYSKHNSFQIDFKSGKTINIDNMIDSVWLTSVNGKNFWLKEKIVYCFDNNKTKIWEFNLNDKLYCLPTINGDMIYFIEDNKQDRLYCLDLDTGEKLWEFNAGESDWLRCEPPVISNGMVYIGAVKHEYTSSRRFLCLDEKTGKTIWEYALNDTPLSSVLSNNRLYISTSGKELYCLDATSGKLINKYQTDSEISTGPIIANGKLYYTIEDTIYCIGDPSDKVLQTMRFQQGSYMMYKNGFANLLAVQPQILSGSLVIPLRAVSQGFGCKVEYDENDKKITLSSSNMTIELWIGNANALVNGESKTLTVAPTVIKGTTMVPLRFISEAFGAQVNYDAKTKVIDIEWQPQD